MKRKNNKAGKKRMVKTEEGRAMKKLKTIGWGVGVSALVCAILLLLVSFLVTVQDIPHKVFPYFAVFSASIGSLAGGFTTSKMEKEKGLFNGLVQGAILAVLLFVIGFFFTGIEVGLIGLLRSVLVVLFGAIGGVIGVNQKKKRKI